MPGTSYNEQGNRVRESRESQLQSVSPHEDVDKLIAEFTRQVQRLSRMPHWAVALACAPLVLLAGCPQQTAKAPVPAPAAAPAVQPAEQVEAPSAPTQTPQQMADALAKSQQEQQLVRRAQDAYQSGLNNYRAGRLEAARSDFDAAVDVMLTSGLDLKADPQLSDQFDQLLSEINSLEMAALKQGNGFSPAVEAAPLDTAEDFTFPPDAALTAKVAEELKTTQSDLPLVVNDYVAGFINYFSNSPAGHAHLLRSLERAGKYKAMIAKDLRDAGVPQDLIYLAVAESGFQPQALNRRSGAGGMWQFMPFNGVYGLERNGWVDERFDPEKSSIAYAHYMKQLYDQFGDWYLAMAAYNWGAGNVQRAVMRTGYADFWELYKRNALPKETKNYVPGIIAAAIVAKNPKQYGLDTLVPEPPVVSDTVTVDYPIDLRLVADVTGAPLGEIVDLNPSLLRMTTPEDADFDLHIPAGTKDVFEKRIAEIPEDKRTTWRFHVVQPGESLETIASSFHERTTQLANINKLTADDPVAAGDELVVPVTASALPHPLRYITRAGDTLVTVADRFNISVEDLRRWNHLTSSRVRAQRSLYVSAPVHLAPVTHVRSRRSKQTATASAHGSSAHSASTAHTKSSHTASGKTAAHGKRASRRH
ncbi:MAG TPA: transglycosylase SLT domain-containing protein [Acidobacteriaceae bacterium]|nr:transglycosylase SLT domain-containing protein [Acidobacteriaceae bacterium]